MDSQIKREQYRMNPAEDYLIFGDDLTEGMWVLREDATMRNVSFADDLDALLRGQRFCRVTKYRQYGDQAAFVGEYVDGYQRAFSCHVKFAWIVKREHPDEPEVPAAGDGEAAAEESPS